VPAPLLTPDWLHSGCFWRKALAGAWAPRPSGSTARCLSWSVRTNPLDLLLLHPSLGALLPTGTVGLLG